MRQSPGKAGPLRARGAWWRREFGASPVLGPCGLPHHSLRSARLRPQHASRGAAKQHDLGSSPGHGANPRAPRHRALAVVWRLLGEHAQFDLCAAAPGACVGHGAARHLSTPAARDRLVLPGRREPNLPGGLAEVPRADSQKKSAATWWTPTTAASRAAIETNEFEPRAHGACGKAARADSSPTRN